ncbi:MAG: Gfo/Idh/MocA family oxidoreductase [Ruminococcaceae bacterium]|nr:Gfo/Idh/MocA family oxidoreductase [Oscillospiraceae bacterium]
MKKNLVVVGFGGMGSWHADHALESDVVTLKGIYDIDPAKSALAKSHGIYAYSSYDEVLADKDVDIITVAIPNDQHKDVVVAALNAGKHVLCEKPVTLSTELLLEMIDAANKNDKMFSVHQNRRFDVDYLAMKTIHDRGEIGDIFNIESRVHGSRGIPSDWRGKKEFGGGMIYDWGIHLIDQIMMIKGKDIKKVYCRLDNITNKEVDDGFKLELYYGDSSRAYIELGTYNFIALPRFYMQGTKGTAIITDWRENAKIVKCKHWHESDVLPVENAAGLTKTMAPRDSVTVDEYEFERPVSDVHDYYRNFCDAIEKKADLMVSNEDMLFDIKVMEAAFRSAKSGQVIDF